MKQLIYGTIISMALIASLSATGCIQRLAKPEDLNTHLKSGKPTLLLFTSDGCGPCNVMKPVYEQLAAQNPDVNFLAVHGAEPASVLRRQYKAPSSPTLVIFNDKGKQVDLIEGGPMTPKEAHLDLNGSIAQARGMPLVMDAPMMAAQEPMYVQQPVAQAPQPMQKKKMSRQQKSAPVMETVPAQQLAINQPSRPQKQIEPRQQQSSKQRQPRETRYNTRTPSNPTKKPVE